MSDELLSAKEAARRLAISVGSFYDWLGQSDQGILVIRGQPITIDYLQGGPRGQGRIKIDASEVERIKERMRVRPLCQSRGARRMSRKVFPGITVTLGHPDRNASESLSVNVGSGAISRATIGRRAQSMSIRTTDA